MTLQSHTPPVGESSPRPGVLALPSSGADSSRHGSSVPPSSGPGPSPAKLRWPSDTELLAALGPWMYERRWFPLKGSGVPSPEALSIVADVELAPGVRDLLIAVARPQADEQGGREGEEAQGGREAQGVQETQEAQRGQAGQSDRGEKDASAPVLVHVPLVLDAPGTFSSFAAPGEPAAAAGFTLPSPPPADASAPPVNASAPPMDASAPPADASDRPVGASAPPAKVCASAEVGRGVALVDGAHHPAFWAAWAQAARLSGSVLDEADARAIGERSGAARVMTGEQSNTNVVMRAPANAATPDLVVKLFRVLSPGPNPDVELSLALAAQGWDRVRKPVAWSTLSWVDASSGKEVSAHSAVACTFIPEAHDGFELFCALAAQDAAESKADCGCPGADAPNAVHADTRQANGAGACATEGADAPNTPGTARRRAIALARDLGATTAQMHSILALACGEHEPASPTHFVASLRQRAAWALEEVPDLRQRIIGIEGKIARVYARLEACDRLEPATRIHGDYHLGQVLREKIPGSEAGSMGDSGRWFVLDFEGEPLRPLAQRLLPDQPMRDVAGMLRSFDYAAAVGVPVPDAAEKERHGHAWLSDVRRAFLEGYEVERPGMSSENTTPGGGDGSASLTTVAQRRAALIDALELDKALYEVVYEARNRPDWLEIPLRGIEALLA
ncbi:phosphotransferase [Schaalia sp. Marseille-Q2122]|uniref:phosphotransferase n=1 Tax=Schaalia sp. Marseille-Q2122 TaxID=2736604 RepID=UPI0020CA72D2|nr:phosphotransferase [Schaalia sp. Marseille-Q2122]